MSRAFATVVVNTGYVIVVPGPPTAMFDTSIGVVACAPVTRAMKQLFHVFADQLTVYVAGSEPVAILYITCMSCGSLDAVGPAMFVNPVHDIVDGVLSKVCENRMSRSPATGVPGRVSVTEVRGVVPSNDDPACWVAVITTAIGSPASNSLSGCYLCADGDLPTEAAFLFRDAFEEHLVRDDGGCELGAGAGRQLRCRIRPPRACDDGVLGAVEGADVPSSGT